MNLTVTEIVDVTNGELIQGKNDILVNGVTIDSRKVNSGELFIAIIGENFDGHDFIEEALNAGCSVAITDREIDLVTDKVLVKVADTTSALQQLANYWRNKNKNLKVVGITGSAGKTTTKDITAALLAEEYRVLKTSGNLNNYYGLPLTLLKLEGNEDVVVLEMGMSDLGEIELLAKIAEPDIGIITNVGETHLETLGSVENVARGKAELVSSLAADGIVVLNHDNPYVREMNDKFKGEKIIYYGLTSGADIYADNIRVKDTLNISFDVNYHEDRIPVSFKRPGRHNIYNALAAIAVAREMGISWEKIKAGLQKVEFSSLRWDVSELSQGAILINDTYNANPLSMRAAIRAAREMGLGRLLVVLGAMLELGQEEKTAHLELGRFISSIGIDRLITVGEKGGIIARGALTAGMDHTKVISLLDNEQASAELINTLHSGDIVLIKGSRRAKMEEIVEKIKELGG